MKKKKIALVGYRLNKGGAERVMANLSMFFDSREIEVHNIIVIDDIAYPYAGKILNLGKLKNNKNGVFNKVKRMVALKRYISDHNFDFIIDFRFRIKPIQEFIISKFIYTSKTIFTVHSSRIGDYLPNNSQLTRLIYGNCHKIVAITNDMQTKIEAKHSLKNVCTIYNPIDIEAIALKSNETSDIDTEYIIGVGEFDTNIKQFDKLIQAYADSKLPSKQIALVILGTGKLKEHLVSVSKTFGVEKLVHFLGFQSNPYKYLSHAKFFVLSSKFEGLPMVLLESLACRTPVIAFDCDTGPREIVIHKENGLLIENQNIEALTSGMNLFLDDESLYSKCKKNALKSVQKFSIENIGGQWLDLLKF